MEQSVRGARRTGRRRARYGLRSRQAAHTARLSVVEAASVPRPCDVPEDVVEHVERAVLGQQRERLAELERVLAVVDLV